MRPSFGSFLFVSVVFLSTACLAQSGFEKGYIVDLKRDTIYGEIFVKRAKSLETSCTFRKDGVIKDYSPDDLLGYGISNSTMFVVRKGFSADGANVFAKVLALGKASLLVISNQYYLEKKSGELHLLTIVTTQAVRDGRTYETRRDAYKGVLNLHFSDCSSALSLIATTSLTDRSLLKIFEQYNGCFSGTPSRTFSNSVGRPAFRAGVIGVVTSSTLTTKTNEFNYVDADEFNNRQYFSVGLTLGVSVPTISEKFSLGLDIYSFKNEYTSTVVKTYTYQSTLDYSVVKVPFYFVFKPWNRKINPFLEVGVSQVFTSTPTAKLTATFNSSSETFNDFVNVKKSITNLMAGGGVTASITDRFTAVVKARIESGKSVYLNYFSHAGREYYLFNHDDMMIQRDAVNVRLPAESISETVVSVVAGVSYKF